MEKEGRKKAFTKLTKEEVQRIKQAQRTDDCAMASDGQTARKKLFEHIEPTSDQNKGNASLTLDCDTMPKKMRNTIDVREGVHNLEALSRENSSIPIDINSPSVDVQGYSGNPIPLCIPQAPLVPAQMLVRNEGKRQGNKLEIDIDNAGFVYSSGKLFAVNGELSQEVGNFALEILEKNQKIQEIVNESNDVIGSEHRLVWKVKILLPDKEFQGYVEDARLFELAWIDKISERRAVFRSSTNAKKLVKKYLQDLIMAEEYQEVKEFASCGWKWLDNGTVCYLTADGAIGFNNNSIKADDKFKLYTKPAEKWQNFRDFLNMRTIIPGNQKNAVFLQYNLLAALLTALFKKSGHQLEFCTALIGKTNTKKTSCGEIFTRVFNRTPSAVPEINFSATEAAVYEIMDHYADAIVMIDDLTPSENDMDAREKCRKLENIIRAYGDRVPRRRSVAFAANSSVKEFTPINGCALITGETFSGGKSSRSRVIVLNFEEGDVDNSVLSYYQENLHTLPNFVEDFLCYVTGQVDQVMNIIAYECKKAREGMKNAIKLPRYIDAYGALYAITSIFRNYIIESGWMNQEDVQKLIEIDRKFLLQVILENDSQVSNIAPGITILEALKYAIDKCGVNVKNLYDIRDEEPENCLICDDNFYYITSEKLWEYAKKYTDYRKIFFPYKNGRELIEPLKMENFLYIKREGSSNRASHKIMVNGKLVNKRFLYLFKEKVDKTWEDLENI